MIEPGSSFSFHNFHLNKEIQFEVNIGIKKEGATDNQQIQELSGGIDDASLVLEWQAFTLNKK